MKNIKYFIPAAILLFLLSNVKVASADAFVINLFYNPATKVLSFDKIAPEKVLRDKNLFVSPTEFARQEISGSYILKLYDEAGREVVSTEFDKKDGTFQLTIPYFSLASGLKIFEKAGNKELFGADLSQFNTCNGNGICEFEKGETSSSCIGDCASSNITFSPQTLQTLKDNNNEIKDPKTGAVLLRGPVAQQPAAPSSVKAAFYKTPYFYAILAFLLILVGGIIVYKKFIKK